MTAVKKRRQIFRGDICTKCGGVFDWGGADRKREHAAWHAETAKRGEAEKALRRRAT